MSCICGLLTLANVTVVTPGSFPRLPKPAQPDTASENPSPSPSAAARRRLPRDVRGGVVVDTILALCRLRGGGDNWAWMIWVGRVDDRKLGGRSPGWRLLWDCLHSVSECLLRRTVTHTT